MYDQIPFFSDLNEEEIRVLESVSRRKTFPKNTVVITEGDNSNTLYIVLKGKAQSLAMDSEGKQMVLNTFETNDYFGEMSFLDNEPRCATVMTKEKTELVLLDGSAFKNILAKHPEIMMKILKGLLIKVRTATKQIEDLAFKDSYGRIARLLTEMADENKEIHEKFTQQEIAERTGLSRETVNRIMSRLFEEGCLIQRRDFIRIARPLPLTLKVKGRQMKEKNSDG